MTPQQLLGPGDGDCLALKSGSTAERSLPLEEPRVAVLHVAGRQDRGFLDAGDVGTLLKGQADAERLDMPDAGHLIPAERPKTLAGADRPRPALGR